MDPVTLIVVIAVVVLLVGVGAGLALVRGRGRRSRPPRPGVDYTPGVGDDATPPRDAPKRTVQDVDVLGVRVDLWHVAVVQDRPLAEIGGKCLWTKDKRVWLRSKTIQLVAYLSQHRSLQKKV